MSKDGNEALLAELQAAGVDVPAAKKALHQLDKAFAGEAGDIPEIALRNWVTAWFPPDALFALGLGLGKKWEKEHAATLEKKRAVERVPGVKKNAKGELVAPDAK